MILRSPVYAILVALSTAGCGDRNAATTGGAGVWRDGGEWHLVEEARIGAADGEGPDVFGSVADVSLDPMGRVWVADGHAHEIRVFDQRGAYVRTVGRKGAGPGEFGMLAGMAWAPDGRLWVVDIANARFTVYDTAGVLVETHPRNSLLSTSPWPGRFDKAGRLYDVDGTMAADGSIVTNIIRSDQGAPATDTFPVPPAEEEMFELRRGDTRNQQITMVSVPFSGQQFWAVAPDGDVWVANTAEYRLQQHAFDGSSRGVIERRHDPVPVSRAERDRELEAYRDFTRQGGRIDVSRIPNTHPALAGFLFDDESRVWVRPVTPADEEQALDVFENDGRYLGRVSLPLGQRSSPRVIRDGRMAVVARDSLGVPIVVVLRVEKPGD